jgi:hypothetical protein
MVRDGRVWVNQKWGVGPGNFGPGEKGEPSKELAQKA